jgi:hypothetical protein
MEYRTCRFLGVFLYKYLIDVNLDDYQNNSRLSVDVDKLPNHVKSVCLSLDLSLFYSIYCSSLLCAVTTGLPNKNYTWNFTDVNCLEIPR